MPPLAIALPHTMAAAQVAIMVFLMYDKMLLMNSESVTEERVDILTSQSDKEIPVPNQPHLPILLSSALNRIEQTGLCRGVVQTLPLR